MTDPAGVTDTAAPAMAGWQQRVVDRSLDDARKKVLDASADFVDAAHALITERGTVEFTVQEVVDRSGRSLRSFYQFFRSKDELLLAVLEESVQLIAARLRTVMDAVADPIERLETYTRVLWDATGPSGDGAVHGHSRAMVGFHRQLEQTRPEELGHIYAPQRQLVLDAVQAAADAGALRADLDPRAAGELVFELTRAAKHAAALGAREGAWGIDELWAFCRHALTH